MNFSTTPPYRPITVRATVEVRGEQFADRFGISRLRQRGESDQVAEQHRAHPPLRHRRGGLARTALPRRDGHGPDRRRAHRRHGRTACRESAAHRTTGTLPPGAAVPAEAVALSQRGTAVPAPHATLHTLRFTRLSTPQAPGRGETQHRDRVMANAGTLNPLQPVYQPRSTSASPRPPAATPAAGSPSRPGSRTPPHQSAPAAGRPGRGASSSPASPDSAHCRRHLTTAGGAPGPPGDLGAGQPGCGQQHDPGPFRHPGPGPFDRASRSSSARSASGTVKTRT